MKPTSLIPPVVALLIVGGWIGTQRRSIASLDQESALLRTHIAAARASAERDVSSRVMIPDGRSAKDKESINWEKVAANGMGDMRAEIHMQQRLLSMTQEELVAALDEIAKLDLPAESRQKLEQMLIGPLVAMDPELALNRFSDRLQDLSGGISWPLSTALAKWAVKDPGKATAWLDEQIAAGKFDGKSLDGKNPTRLLFEGAMIRTLLPSNPDAAGRRLGGMPEDQRASTLRQFSSDQIKEEDQKAFANLVREQVPEEERNNLIARVASNAASKGYPEVTAYLDRIEATPAERAACAGSAAQTTLQQISQTRKITSEDIDSMRGWISTQAPDSTDKLTGSMLARSTGWNQKLEFAEAAAFTTRYHETSGNDDVLIGFLNGLLTNGRTDKSHNDEARVLAGKISDPKRRDEILSLFK